MHDGMYIHDQYALPNLDEKSSMFSPPLGSPLN